MSTRTPFAVLDESSVLKPSLPSLAPDTEILPLSSESSLLSSKHSSHEDVSLPNEENTPNDNKRKTSTTALPPSKSVRASVVDPKKAIGKASATTASSNTLSSRASTSRLIPGMTRATALRQSATTLRQQAAKPPAVSRPPTSVTRSSVSTSSLRSTSAAMSSSRKPPAAVDNTLQDRVQLLEKMLQSLQSDITSQKSQSVPTPQLKDLDLANLSTYKATLEQNLQQQRAEVEKVSAGNHELLLLIEKLKEAQRRDADEFQAKLRSMEFELENSKIKYQILSEENDRNKKEILTQKLTIGGLESQLADTKSSLERSEEDNAEKRKQVSRMEAEIKGHLENIAALEKKSREDEITRRKLHNTIQELKGNIRVYCRVRPSTDETNVYSFPASNSVELAAPPEKNVIGQKEAKGKKWVFNFDKVFQPSATQSEVFYELSQLVQSALDGYNTCIFTYGQTGSGKTYTMEGPSVPTQETRGVIPRTVEQVFQTAKDLEELGWNYELEASFIEIYNEKIRDLLKNSENYHKEKLQTDGKKESIAHDIKHDQYGNTSVTNITVVSVTQASQIYELLNAAGKNRAVGATKCNVRSSRSHSVFQLKMKGKNTITEELVSSVLSLIDLAGSERLKESGATGERLEETKNINKSLSCLADVIAALANKESHVPYRNSKLTYLLQNSLGGNSKTLMLVNVSPEEKDLNETLGSLRFATKVNACEIGTAKKHGAVDLKL